MNRMLAQYILRYLTQLGKIPLWKSFEFLEESQWWDQKQFRDYQEEKLQKLLVHSQQNVPFYKTWFLQSGHKPSDISLDNLSLLPAISKAQLRENLNEFIATEYSEPVEEAKTSGSTGVSLHFPKSLKSSAFQLGAMYRGHRWYGVEPGAKEARLWGIHVNPLSRFKMVTRDILLNRFREREYNLYPDTLKDFTAKLIRLKPEYLMGYTSMVAQYAHFLNNTGYDGSIFGLKMVKCTSESIHDDDRAIVEKVFGCPLVSEYGAAETGLISFQCDHGCNHVMEDCCIVEYVQPEEPLDDKNLKEIIVTNLDNFAMPVLRYRVGDFVVPSDRICHCGRKSGVIEKIVGRVSDIIRTSDGRQWHSIILYYIMKGLDEKFGGVIQFKVFQKQVDTLEFFIVPEKKLPDSALEYVREKCTESFGPMMHVEFNIVDSIPRESSGKLRDFVSDL
ncbi:MAG: phenylacetate--CoA ligase family protein [Desulfobacteraceae bacterium]|nr:MAG: phenylacetate--CoA ligase family protein [Desulfobacteraceae bacterium]